MVALKRQRNTRPTSIKIPRLHWLADRIARQELGYANCNLRDAVLAAAGTIDWLASQDQVGAIIVADSAGRFITRVWNLRGFNAHADKQETGVVYGTLVLQPDVPAGPNAESLRLVVEVPE